MKNFLFLLILGSTSLTALPYFGSLGDDSLDALAISDHRGPDRITTVYDRDGFTVFYPAGKENEWSVSRTSYGHLSLKDVEDAGKVSRDTTDALLHGRSVLDAAFPD